MSIDTRQHLDAATIEEVDGSNGIAYRGDVAAPIVQGEACTEGALTLFAAGSSRRNASVSQRIRPTTHQAHATIKRGARTRKELWHTCTP